MRFLPASGRRQLADRGMTTKKKIHPAVRMDFMVRVLTCPLAALTMFSLFWNGRMPPLWLVVLVASYGVLLPTRS
jgi:hypothetical protein